MRIGAISRLNDALYLHLARLGYSSYQIITVLNRANCYGTDTGAVALHANRSHVHGIWKGEFIMKA